MSHITPRPIPRATQLVINWHITEACNYACQYCYATWNQALRRREVIHDPSESNALLRALYEFFSPDNADNPLRQVMHWNSVRLNIAGGEPLLYEQKLIATVRAARRIGFEVSLISNGSRFTAENIKLLAPSLSLLGISMDSPRTATNAAIGRKDKHGTVPNLHELAAVTDVARTCNPKLRLKLNTVVNRENHHEDMSRVIERFRPERWKVLRMLPIANDDLAVSRAEFERFVARHAHLEHIMCAEDNSDMIDSYIMVDPMGRFFQNTSRAAGAGYTYSLPILACGAASAFASMSFSANKFESRYTNSPEK